MVYNLIKSIIQILSAKLSLNLKFTVAITSWAENGGVLWFIRNVSNYKILLTGPDKILTV